jgi:4-carboxymuconolactone decarboxylase
MDEGPCQPLADADWPAEIADLRDGFAGRLNVYRVMAHHPALLRAWVPLRQHLVTRGTLGAELTEIAILRTAHRLGSAYEWAHHVSRARKLGMTEARINATKDQPEGIDGDLVEAVDSIIDRHRISSSLESKLASEIGRKGVFDLIATVGFYSVLGTLLMTYNTPIDVDILAEDRSAQAN